MEQIEKDLREAREYVPNMTRVFLENGDPFCLSAEKLSVIAVKIHEYLPKVETIAMYASIKNIRGKSDEELRRLRSLGINELNIGVESGLDEALSRMNKGYTAEEALTELARLNAAGMDYGANIIFGCAGEGHSRENAEATARLLNETKPYLRIPAARSTTICSPEHSGRVPSANIWKRKNGSYPFWIWKAVITLACIRPIWCRCMDT